MDPVTVVFSGLGVIVAMLAAIAAFGSWKAAVSAARSAETLTRIERDRRHAELTPRFQFTCTRANVGPSASLQVRLTGPPELGQLDNVRIMIRDDRPRHTISVANGPSPEDIASVIWGPLRFRAGVDGADRLGRTIEGPPLQVLESATLTLEDSHTPRWINDTVGWRTQQLGEPLRLTVTCSQAGRREPWIVHADVTIEQEPDR